MGIKTKFSSLGNINVQVEKPWTQTILTSNGVMGGTTCACTSSAVYPVTSSRGTLYLEAFRAFNGIPTNSNNIITIGAWHTYNCCMLKSPTGYVIYYTPTPIKVSKITFERTNWIAWIQNLGIWSDTGIINKAKVYGSNDNTNWTLLKDTTDTTSGVIDGIQSPDFYKYIKIQSVATGNGQEALFENVKIQAVYLE